MTQSKTATQSLRIICSMSERTQNCTGQYQISFLNNKKVPITSPLFHENEFVLDFKKKPEIRFSPNSAPYKVTTVNYHYSDSITLPKNFYQPLGS